MGTLEALVAHWTSAYDWRSAEREINRHPQFHARIDGGDIHFVHVRGSGRQAAAARADTRLAGLVSRVPQADRTALLP